MKITRYHLVTGEEEEYNFLDAKSMHIWMLEQSIDDRALHSYDGGLWDNYGLYLDKGHIVDGSEGVIERFDTWEGAVQTFVELIAWEYWSPGARSASYLAAGVAR